MTNEAETSTALREALTGTARAARLAAAELRKWSSSRRRELVLAFAAGLREEAESILAANEADLAEAKDKALSAAMIDRLRLSSSRLEELSKALVSVARQEDPVGEVLSEYQHPKGLIIEKRRVPIGVILVIYESRPNVTADAAALCLRAGNAVILRGGREASQTNAAIVAALRKSGAPLGLPEAALSFVESTDRAAVPILVSLEGLIDLAIPRGGPALISAVLDSARVPVIKHAKGLCHIYVEASADIDQACAITVNAKVQRPGVCNAAETVLVDAAIAPRFLPKLAEQLRGAGVELRGDARCRALIPGCAAASAEDWDTEYLDLILAIRVVDGIDEAIAHIARHGSGHSDAILSTNEAACRRFTESVDSAAVYVNASTRFTDGGEFGLGAEIGISTDRLHARGPMGLAELTTYKYVVHGAGQTR